MLFSIEKVMDEMELRNNHYMMTLKRFRGRKKISRDRQAGGKCWVGCKEILYTRIIPTKPI